MLVNNPKRYGTACEGIMFDENDRFLTESLQVTCPDEEQTFLSRTMSGQM